LCSKNKKKQQTPTHQHSLTKAGTFWACRRPYFQAPLFGVIWVVLSHVLFFSSYVQF
jgi:hypothetical protein